MRSRLMAAAVVGGLVFTGAGAVQAQPGDIVVDDDKAQCAKATHSSIQSAVQAAAPGQTVWVCAGVYPETVTVDKDRLVLRGVHYGDAGQRCTNPAAAPDPTLDAILQVPPNEDGGFVVEANGVTLTGFVVRGNTMGPGIATSPEHSGHRIDRNVVEDNAVGVALHSNGGAATVLAQNCVRRQTGAMESGVGVLSREGLANASIENNRFAQNTTRAIDLAEADDDTVLANVTVQRNESAGDGGFVRVADSQSTTVTNNTVRDFGTNAGVHVADDNAGVLVTNNTLRGGVSPALRLTVDDPMDDDEAPSTNVQLLRNTSEAALRGVDFEPDSAAGVLLAQNHITFSTTDGITVRQGNHGSTVRQNHVRDNGEDGIHFESGTTGNVVTQNSSFGNVGFDCRDDGGADTWEKNQGETSSPPGLCTPNGS